MIPRIEPAELITKYQLHPELCDIFVEGDFDRDLIIDHLSAISTKTTPTVLPIDSVEISDSDLIQENLNPGSNKSRTIFLASILEQHFKDMPVRSICIVDADHDRVLQKTRNQNGLIYTDYTCMEMYFLGNNTLRRFFTLTCKLPDSEVDKFLIIANKILPILFIARALNEKLNLNVKPPSYQVGLTKSSDLSSFDSASYIKKYANQIKDRTSRESLINQGTSLQSNLPDDLRHKAHGHDFVELIFDYLWKRNSIKLHNKVEDVITYGNRLLCTAADHSGIAQSNLSAYLSARI